MKRALSATALAAALSIAALTAQTPPSTYGQSTDKPSSKARDDTSARHVTVVGCLQQGSEPNSFTLTNVAYGTGIVTAATAGSGVSGTGTSAGTGTTGTGTTGTGTSGTGTPPTTAPSPGTAMAAPSAYRLLGGGGLNLGAHVGHKVEITGTAPGPGTATSVTATSTTTRSTTTPSGASARLNVGSMKHVAPNCP